MLIDHVIGGKYRITELIGQGGMGTVFEAVHTGTGTRVAIKVIVSTDIQEEISLRFAREARAAGALDSQHIVRIFDMGTDDRTGSPYMVMERLFGEDLSQLMRRVGALAPETAISILAQATMGVAKAHEASVVHRDIKPANLFLHDGEMELVVKILDFGIAKVLQDVRQRAEEGGLTRTGSMLGSPHYMSPEQAQGLRSVDHRSDIWSLGVVLYKMLTGQTPHAHLTTLGQVILAICSKPARPVQELAPWVPPEIAAIVHRALQPDPNLRFQSAHEMLAAMQPMLAQAPRVTRAQIAPLSNVERARVAPPLAAYVRPDMPTNGTHHGLVQTPLPEPASRNSRGVMIALGSLGALALIGLVGIGVSVKARSRVHPEAAAAPSVLAPEPVTSSATSTPPPVIESQAQERRVVVAVPPNAAVDVEGEKLSVTDGNVELRGPLGGVVKVHVVVNGQETTQPVAITEGGPMPPKIALGSGKPANAKLAATASAKASPTSAATGINVKREFE